MWSWLKTNCFSLSKNVSLGRGLPNHICSSLSIARKKAKAEFGWNVAKMTKLSLSSFGHATERLITSLCNHSGDESNVEHLEMCKNSQVALHQCWLHDNKLFPPPYLFVTLNAYFKHFAHHCSFFAIAGRPLKEVWFYPAPRILSFLRRCMKHAFCLNCCSLF